MRRGYSSSDRTVDDLRPPPRGIPLCGTPPSPGEQVWRGDVLGTIQADGSWLPLTRATEPRERLCDRLVDLVFCPACLTLRIHPTHLLVCSDRRRKVMKRHGH